MGRDERMAIEVEDARTHNLRGVSCRIPHRAITVVTGVSGSGKSSLAFDTVYAEGQRRYVETLSTYARQFLQQMQKPPVGAVRNVPPSLALRQGNSGGAARSTVATLTEISDLAQVLWAGVGVTRCRSCGGPVEAWTVSRVLRLLSESASGERVMVLATLRPAEGADAGDLLRRLAVDGWTRLWVSGRIVGVDEPEATAVLKDRVVRVVVDRGVVGAEGSRLPEALEQAFGLGEGTATIVFRDREGASGHPERRFDRRFSCSECGTVHHQPIPALFNPTSQIGRCTVCDGFGRTVDFDPARIVPDPLRTLEGGAIACFLTPTTEVEQGVLLSACMRRGVPIDVPWHRLRDEDRAWVLRGGAGYRGVRGFLAEMESDRHKVHKRIFVARFRGYTHCGACEGSGLSPDALSVRVGGRTLAELLSMRVDDASAWMEALDPGAEVARAMEVVLRELRERLGFLRDAGVGYLTLDRQARTLSGGEMHRMLLATSLGRMLTDTCYVLDEPTAGLHAHDTQRLFGVIEKLRDVGNTVLVVEHDPDIIALADHVIELGPEGGERGGRLLYEGDVPGLRRSETPTGVALRGRRAPRVAPALPDRGFLEVRHACLHNLRDVSARFPKGALSVVTGVSGSGKSTLIHDALWGRLLEARGQASSEELGPLEVVGDDFSEIVLVDQASLTRSSRSCALTLSGAYGPIRELFAATEMAVAQELSAGDFSFNTPGGRCDRCEGTGALTVEMHFIADVEIPCDVCHGRRFRESVLRCLVRGRTIADVFQMTIDEGVDFFSSSRAIVQRLEPMQRVGLGYLRLGQTTSQLSGGEAQRMKLSSYVGQVEESRGSVLFLFDEPTLGLHVRDVEVLGRAIRELTSRGHTALVVEHNLDFVRMADWVVDLGPGAGPDGGRVVYEGPLSGLVASEGLTGRYMRVIEEV